jgi:hypothetical protein
VALRKRARARIRRPGGANAIVRAVPGLDNRCDSDVAKAIVGVRPVPAIKALVRLGASIDPAEGTERRQSDRAVPSMQVAK